MATAVGPRPRRWARADYERLVEAGILGPSDRVELAQQARIRAEEWRYRHNDGRLGPWERTDLHRDLNHASRSVYRQRHDGQGR